MGTVQTAMTTVRKVEEEEEG